MRKCHQWSPPGAREQRCEVCGAMCRRDGKGVIEVFTVAGYLGKPEREEVADG